MPTTSRAPHWRRVLTTLTLSAVALVAGAGIAAAHVSVNPSEATAGDEAIKLTFRVPNESATAGTVAITVALPTDHPFASASVKAVPGWTVTPTKTTLPTPVTEGATTIKEAVTSVTWTATAGTQIAPGEFAEFDISAGPVPDTTSMEFPTTQTYSDGTVVEWNEPTPASGEEPEHPVPTLTITAAADGASSEAGHSHTEGGTEPSESTGSDATDAGTSAEAANTQASVTAAADSASTDGGSSTATIVAVISLVVAAAALLVAAVALRRRPSTTREG